MSMKIWKKLSDEEMKTRIFSALKENVDYQKSTILGIPASHLDDKVFSQDHAFIKDAPFISTLVQNPNHIGCHTFGESESFFKGTQEIERELIELCSVDILKSETNECDGYVASGGTEANIQAIWIYRNYFKKELGLSNSEIVILCSSDSHYSMDKAANLLELEIQKIPVDFRTRKINEDKLGEAVSSIKEKGKKACIVVCNMMTTMFGSIDNPDQFVHILKQYGLEFKIHVDGAFGGFYFPFISQENNLNFENGNITSFTLDAHKMAQAPYGTGIFIVRKGMINYAQTDASYVEGEDCTLIGSRSGANAIAIWMILMKNGPYGWSEKLLILQKRTEWMCKKLNDLNISFYRHPDSNIITIESQHISSQTAKRFGLVPDKHNNPQWYKIVVMDHVTIDKLQLLIEEIKKAASN